MQNAKHTKNSTKKKSKRAGIIGRSPNLPSVPKQSMTDSNSCGLKTGGGRHKEVKMKHNYDCQFIDGYYGLGVERMSGFLDYINEHEYTIVSVLKNIYSRNRRGFAIIYDKGEENE